MSVIQRLGDSFEFPSTREALDDPNGLLAVGGDLSPGRLLSAYRRGIFPWYDEPQPILWWSPDPRSVLFPHELHVSRSLAKTLRADRLRLAVDTRFREVMACCAQLRGDGLGTWIDDAMIDGYGRLHDLGYAHSVEVLDAEGLLIGGLYGVALGRVFFGESMFSKISDTSKVALVALADILQRGQFAMIDCQLESSHLNSMGARNISRDAFEELLGVAVQQAPAQPCWSLPTTCGELS